MRPIDADQLTESVKRMVGKCAYIDTKLMLNLIESMPKLSNSDMVHAMRKGYEEQNESSKR